MYTYWKGLTNDVEKAVLRSVGITQQENLASVDWNGSFTG